MSDNNPGAGGKGTSGYWEPSSDDRADEAFESRYRTLIPKGKYKTSAHNPLTCDVCKRPDTDIIFVCQSGGIGFGSLPTVTAREGEYKVTRCVLCNEVRSKRKIRHKKAN